MKRMAAAGCKAADFPQGQDQIIFFRNMTKDPKAVSTCLPFRCHLRSLSPRLLIIKTTGVPNRQTAGSVKSTVIVNGSGGPLNVWGWHNLAGRNRRRQQLASGCCSRPLNSRRYRRPPRQRLRTRRQFHLRSPLNDQRRIPHDHRAISRRGHLLVHPVMPRLNSQR